MAGRPGRATWGATARSTIESPCSVHQAGPARGGWQNRWRQLMLKTGCGTYSSINMSPVWELT
eukprot:2642069-Prymnesium_polylepis.1